MLAALGWAGVQSYRLGNAQEDAAKSARAAADAALRIEGFRALLVNVNAEADRQIAEAKARAAEGEQAAAEAEAEAARLQARLTDAQRQMQAAKRSEEHTSELQSLMRISYAVFCLKKKKTQKKHNKCKQAQ